MDGLTGVSQTLSRPSNRPGALNSLHVLGHTSLAADQGMDHAEDLLDHRDRFSDDAGEHKEYGKHAAAHQ